MRWAAVTLISLLVRRLDFCQSVHSRCTSGELRWLAGWPSFKHAPCAMPSGEGGQAPARGRAPLRPHAQSRSLRAEIGQIPTLRISLLRGYWEPRLFASGTATKPGLAAVTCAGGHNKDADSKSRSERTPRGLVSPPSIVSAAAERRADLVLPICAPSLRLPRRCGSMQPSVQIHPQGTSN